MDAREKQRRNLREKATRKRRAKERRFNFPLRYFIKVKYPQIFNEYEKFYNTMNEQTPNRKDLTTSAMFKEWLMENTAQIPLPIGDCTIDCTIEVPPTTVAEPSRQPEPSTSSSISHGIDRVNEIINDVWNDEILRSILDQVDVNELPDNGFIQDVLGQTNEDEGIEVMSKFDELEQFDIEPLDFSKEVEPFDF